MIGVKTSKELTEDTLKAKTLPVYENLTQFLDFVWSFIFGHGEIGGTKPEWRLHTDPESGSLLETPLIEMCADFLETTLDSKRMGPVSGKSSTNILKQLNNDLEFFRALNDYVKQATEIWSSDGPDAQKQTLKTLKTFIPKVLQKAKARNSNASALKYNKSKMEGVLNGYLSNMTSLAQGGGEEPATSGKRKKGGLTRMLSRA